MAENWVTITADISKVNNYESCRDFLTSLHKGGAKSVRSELEVFIKSQGVNYSVDDFTQIEYLDSLQDLTIKEDKKSFKAEFNTGSGVVEFCNEFYNLFKGINAKRLKIKAVDDHEFAEIDWKTLGKSVDELLAAEAFKKPKKPVLKGANGSYALKAPDGTSFASLNLKSGHLNGLQKILNPGDGSAVCEVGFKSGVPDGNIILFHRDGSEAIKATYKKGLLHGPAFGWDASGHPRIKSCFKHGELDGHQIVQMSVDDEPFLEANYIDGTPDGIFHWRKSDAEIYDIEFRDGKPVGEVEDKVLIGIGVVEDVLKPHRKHMNFVDPNEFYTLISRLNLEPLDKTVS